MRLLHVSNIVSHHQIPLARCFAQSLGEGNFRFAATLLGLPDRQQMGWDSSVRESWILRVGENAGDRKEFEAWWDDADVVLCGERLFKRMQARVRNGRLTFHKSERWWKPPIGRARLLHPSFLRMTKQFCNLSTFPSFHFMPVGGYAAADIKYLAPFTGRMWQWGYFTEVPDLVPSCDRSGEDLRILWAGRMLGWKRVDTLIVAFAQLSKRFPRAILTLAGHGPREARLKKLAAELLSPGTFEFLPAMPVQEVLRLMRQHHIYVLPSTGTEGWGAVVNEAMTQGCAVVASEAAGSAKTIVRHGINGMLFPPNDAEALGQLLCELAESPELRKRLAEEGQRTITHGWTPAVAAERFLAVSDALLANREVPVFTDGPMSPAWE